MKELVVLAHPTDGLARKISESYISSAKKFGKEIEFIDLYRKEPPERFLSFVNRDEAHFDPEIISVQSMISGASRITFIFPVWWYDAPAIMKNFFDRYFTKDFAFDWSSQIPKGLLKGKSVRFIMTAGAPAFIYQLGLIPVKKMWKAKTDLCGMKSEFHIFGSLNDATDKDRAAIVEKAGLIAEN